MNRKQGEVREVSAQYRATLAEAADVPVGYKRTEVGVIPEDWEIKLLPEVCRFRAGKAHEQYISGLGQYVCVNSKFISTGGTVRKHCDRNLCPANKEDILMVMSDLPNGRALAKAYFVDTDNLFAVNQRVCSLTAYSAFSKYLYYVLNRNPYFLRFDDGVSQTHLLNHVFEKCPIVLPPNFEEQHAIATALSDVDALIAALDKLIAKKRAIKTAAMQQLLTGKQRLPGFTGEWEVKRLGDVADIDPENLPSTTDPNYSFVYISLEQVDRGRLVGWTEVTFGSAPSRARRVLRCGDVIVSTVRPNLMAHLHFIDQVANAVCSTGFSVIRSRQGFSEPAYVFAHLFGHIVNEQIEKIVSGSNYPAINSSDVRAIELPFPPTVEEQTAIAQILSDMDAEITALEKRRAKTRAIKQGMMQELLTGRTRLV